MCCVTNINRLIWHEMSEGYNQLNTDLMGKHNIEFVQK